MGDSLEKGSKEGAVAPIRLGCLDSSHDTLATPCRAEAFSDWKKTQSPPIWGCVTELPGTRHIAANERDPRETVATQCKIRIRKRGPYTVRPLPFQIVRGHKSEREGGIAGTDGSDCV